MRDTKASFATRLVDHILHMRRMDVDYARWALRRYHEAMPELGLMDLVKARIAQMKEK